MRTSGEILTCGIESESESFPSSSASSSSLSSLSPSSWPRAGSTPSDCPSPAALLRLPWSMPISTATTVALHDGGSDGAAATLRAALSRQSGQRQR